VTSDLITPFPFVNLAGAENDSSILATFQQRNLSLQGLGYLCCVGALPVPCPPRSNRSYLHFNSPPHRVFPPQKQGNEMLRARRNTHRDRESRAEFLDSILSSHWPQTLPFPRRSKLSYWSIGTVTWVVHLVGVYKAIRGAYYPTRRLSAGFKGMSCFL
jgi:hypothetical protein